MVNDDVRDDEEKKNLQNLARPNTALVKKLKFRQFHRRLLT
jgi:hypothetical protein